MPKAHHGKRVLLLPSPPEGQDATLPLITLTHPRIGCKARYFWCDGKLFELQSIGGGPLSPSSWFVGEEVVSDGRMFVASLIDEVFMLLPVVEQSTKDGRFRCADDLCVSWSSECSEGYASLFRAMGGESLSRALSLICDVQRDGATPYFRLSPERALAWMRCKVARTARALEHTYTRNTYARYTARKSSAHAQGDQSDEERLVAACDLVAEYLSPEWRAKLRECYERVGLMKSCDAPSGGGHGARDPDVEETRAWRHQQSTRGDASTILSVPPKKRPLKRPEGNATITSFFKKAS